MFHLEEPLHGKFRFNRHVGAFRITYLIIIVFNLFEQCGCIKVFYDLLADIFAGHADIHASSFADGGIIIENVDALQIVLFAQHIVVHIVGRCDLQTTCTKFNIDIAIFNDRNHSVDQRHNDFLAAQPLVFRVGRVDAHGGVAHDGLRTGGGDDGVLARAFLDHVSEIEELGVLVMVDDLLVGEGTHAQLLHELRIDHRPYWFTNDEAQQIQAHKPVLEQDEAVESFCCVLEDNIFFTYADRQGIAKARGVDYGYEEQSGIRDLTVEGEFSLYKGDIPQACIGATLAYNNGIHVKFLDPLDLYYPDGGKDISLINPEASLNHSRIWPGSLISVTSTVDAGTMIVPLATMQELTGNYDELTGIEVRLKDGSEAYVRKFIKSSPLNGEFILKDRFSQNPSLFRMMEFEKLAIMMILLFVVVIVAFNVFGSLSMLIMEKKEDCGTLRAMGADEKLIRRIFIIEGWLVTLVGMAAGAVFGTGLAILQQHTGIIKMPGSFTVSAYPVALHWFDVLASCLAVAAIGILIALPAASARRD